MENFQSIGVLNKLDTLCLSIFCVLKQLIHEMGFICVELDNAFQRTTQHSVLILSGSDSISNGAHDSTSLDLNNPICDQGSMDIRAGSAIVDLSYLDLVFLSCRVQLTLVHSANLLFKCIADFLL